MKALIRLGGMSIEKPSPRQNRGEMQGRQQKKKAFSQLGLRPFSSHAGSLVFSQSYRHLEPPPAPRAQQGQGREEPLDPRCGSQMAQAGLELPWPGSERAECRFASGGVR